MKSLMYILVLLPVIGFAQKRKDHERTMERFVKYYNNIQGDSIISMWEDGPSDHWMYKLWGNEHVEMKHKQYGTILSYRYLGVENEYPDSRLAVFETQFSMLGWRTTSFTIDKRGYIGTFRLLSNSDEIDKMLKAKKK